MQVLAAAHAAERGARQLALPFVQVVPQGEEGEEVRPRLGEARVHRVRGLAGVRGPFPRILDGQRRRDDQDLVDASLVPGLEDHPAEARVHRQPGQLPADAGQPARALARRDRAQLLQQPDAVRDVAGLGRVHEREVLDLAEVERCRLQDDRGEAGAQDLRVGELRSRAEVVLAVQPDTDAVGRPPAPALALIRRGLGDRLDGQPLHLGSVAVPGDPRGARVDHVPDARHGQRGLRDVGGQHHAWPLMRLEDAVLLSR